MNEKLNKKGMDMRLVIMDQMGPGPNSNNIDGSMEDIMIMTKGMEADQRLRFAFIFGMVGHMASELLEKPEEVKQEH